MPKKQKNIFFIFLSLLALIVIFTSSVTFAYPWYEERVTIKTDYPSPSYPKEILTDSKNRPVIVFGLKWVNVAKRTSDGWVKKTLPENFTYGVAGLFTACLDQDDDIHIAYYHQMNDTLKHAEMSGNDWIIEIVNESGISGQGLTGDFDIIVDNNEKLHIIYSTDNIIKATKDNGSWSYDKIIKNQHAEYLSVDSDSEGNLIFVYYNDAELNYVNKELNKWNEEVIFNNTYIEIPKLKYRDYEHSTVYFINESSIKRLNIKDNSIETITNLGYEGGYYYSVEYNNEGNPYLIYVKEWNSLNLMYKNNTEWSVNILKKGEKINDNIATTTSLDIDSNDVKHVVYVKENERALYYMNDGIPKPIKNVKISQTKDKIKIEWDRPISKKEINEYHIYRKKEGEKWELYRNTSSTDFIDANVSHGKKYNYKISVENYYGKSNKSREVSILKKNKDEGFTSGFSIMITALSMVFSLYIKRRN